MGLVWNIRNRKHCSPEVRCSVWYEAYNVTEIV